MGLLKALNFPKSLIKATPVLASRSSVLAAGACRQSPGSPACWPPGPPLGSSGSAGRSCVRWRSAEAEGRWIADSD